MKVFLKRPMIWDILFEMLKIRSCRRKIYMNITVYLGANEGNDPCLRKAVEELGTGLETAEML